MKGVCDVCDKKINKKRMHGELDILGAVGPFPDWWYLCEECVRDTRRYLVGLTASKGGHPGPK